jgi:hypothetical protein
MLVPSPDSARRGFLFPQPITPRRQRLQVNWLRDKFPIDQVVFPHSSLQGLQDRTRLMDAEVDFNAQVAR